MNIVFLAYRDWALDAIEAISNSFEAQHTFVVILSPLELRQYVDQTNGTDTVLIAVGWSWIIDADICTKFLCLGVHPSDLPSYRGGSPIQHQIIDGIVRTKCSLFKIEEKLDAGDIWGKSSLMLDGHSMDEIFENIKLSTIDLITTFLNNCDDVKPQSQNLAHGSYFKRRSPHQSRLEPEDFDFHDITRLYNTIRCLTAPYPNAYIEDANGNRLYFERVSFVKGELPQ